MNKKSVIGIIIAVAVLVGIVSMISYGNTLSNTTISSSNATTQIPIPSTTPTNPASEPIKTAGRHLSIELNESVGVKTNP